MQIKSAVLASLAFAGSAFAQSNVTLLSALSMNPNLSQLLGFLNTSSLQPVIAQLATAQNVTLLAPSNAAFSKLLSSNSSLASTLTSGNNTAAIAAVLQYHVINGAYSNFSMLMFPHTQLTNPAYTNVTNGQVVGVTPGNPVKITSGMLMTSNATNATAFSGGYIYAIDQFLTPPGSVSATALNAGLTSVVGALNATNLTSTVNSARDITLFAPSNSAFAAIANLAANLTAAQAAAILRYHLVTGTVGYSTTLTNGTKLQTAGNGTITITVMNGTVYANQAKVIVPNVLVANGVVHIIDSVLNPSNTTAMPNPTATGGSPAFSGASSASNVPYTSGYTAPSTAATATASAPGASSSKAAAPMRTAAVGAAALFGGVAAVMNM